MSDIIENFKRIPSIRPRPPVFIHNGVRYSSAAERDRAIENDRIRNLV